MSIEDRIQLGSETARGGFRNETDVIIRFNNWKIDEISQKWLEAMGYVIEDIEYVNAMKIRGSFKADVQVQVRITIKLKDVIDCQNLQVKLVSNASGFNQIDKRWVKSYVALWDINEEIEHLLKLFTGELEPNGINLSDGRRMFAHDFIESDRDKLLNFFKENKTLIISDILKGRGKFSAEWMLVILRLPGEDSFKWALKPMNYVMNFYDGDVVISPRGSFKIGKITIQRKGGDAGRASANMLQFKINPALLVERC
jgi:hypothetical protein